MSWFSDSEGYPRVERILLGVSVIAAAIGWPLALWVDPGAINMAAAGTVGTLIGGIATAILSWTRSTGGNR